MTKDMKKTSITSIKKAAVAKCTTDNKSGVFEIVRNDIPAWHRTEGAIQKKYPFHAGLILELISLIFSLLKNRLNSLIATLTVIKTANPKIYPEAFNINLLVKPYAAI